MNRNHSGAKLLNVSLSSFSSSYGHMHAKPPNDDFVLTMLIRVFCAVMMAVFMFQFIRWIVLLKLSGVWLDGWR